MATFRIVAIIARPARPHPPRGRISPFAWPFSPTPWLAGSILESGAESFRFESIATFQQPRAERCYPLADP
jgi:hypothetical protein